MANTADESSPVDRAPPAPPGLHPLLDWLAQPPPADPADDLAPLRAQLLALRDIATPLSQRHQALDRLFDRSAKAADGVLASLETTALPVPRKTRQAARELQALLELLAQEYLHLLDNDDGQAATPPQPSIDQALWRAIQALSRHLSASDRLASPPGVGVWQTLHGAYQTVLRHRLADRVPAGETSSLRHAYFSALLLAAAQPVSFTSRELTFVVDCVRLFGDLVEPLPEAAPDRADAFWINPRLDAPAFADARKPPPPEPGLLHFGCGAIAKLIKKQLAALDAGASASALNLPEFAATPSGRGVLCRLAERWGQPSKRRFQRRRQSYRAVLCAGLSCLWRLFQAGDADAGELSSWMITNESPDGYAIMHVSGKTARLTVGDVIALRTVTQDDWQICLVRWALSENPEHLELGLQLLSLRATAALLARPAAAADEPHTPVLILPEIPSVRESEIIIAPSGLLPRELEHVILVIEGRNVEIREVRTTRLDEQTSMIDMFAIQREDMPYHES